MDTCGNCDNTEVDDNGDIQLDRVSTDDAGDNVNAHYKDGNIEIADHD